MENGFSAFKAMAMGVAAMLAFVVVTPEVTGGQFDLLRIAKGKKPGRLTDPIRPTRNSDDQHRLDDGHRALRQAPARRPPRRRRTASTSELSMVPSNFDINSELVAMSGTGAIPPSARPDYVGAFRFICNPGHVAYDDPIVFPGQPGKSHLHQFYGNTAVDAYSTYQSLRTTGNSTCMSPLNRSAYWMPAMMDGRGNVVRPDAVAIYYKRRPKTDPKCSLTSGDPQAEGNCVPLPNGLKFVFGYNMSNPSQTPTGSLWFNCQGPGSVPGHYADIVTAAKYCPAGAQLGAVIEAPGCWDGKNLDSADHRSHVSYASYGTWGYKKCPSTHPYVIPSFTMGAWYTVDQSLDRSGTWTAGKTLTWSLSSNSMAGMPQQRPGTTFHADWFGAWDNTVMSMWMDNCIDKLLNCSGGDLGNGKQMKQFAGFSWTASPRLVPAP